MATPPPQPPPPPPQAPPPPPSQQGAPGMAIAGFVVGLVGLLLFWAPIVGPVVSIAGVVFSVIGLRQANERQAPRGLAIAGLVCAIIGTVAGLAITAVWIWATDELEDEFDDLTFTTTTFNLVIGWRMLREKLPPLRG